MLIEMLLAAVLNNKQHNYFKLQPLFLKILKLLQKSFMQPKKHC